MLECQQKWIPQSTDVLNWADIFLYCYLFLNLFNGKAQDFQSGYTQAQVFIKDSVIRHTWNEQLVPKSFDGSDQSFHRCLMTRSFFILVHGRKFCGRKFCPLTRLFSYRLLPFYRFTLSRVNSCSFITSSNFIMDLSKSINGQCSPKLILVR